MTAAYEQLLTALDSIEPTHFLSPGGTPSTDTDLTYTVGQQSHVLDSPQSTTPPEGVDPSTSSSLALTTPAPVNTSEDTSTEDETSEDTSTGPASDPSSWTPADIANMVTAISQITGSIPDMVTAVSDLASNVDEIVTAAGNATAAVIDAADNQPSALPVEETEETEDTDGTTDGGEEEASSEDSDEVGSNDSDSEDSSEETKDTESAAVEVGVGESATDSEVPASTAAANAGASPATTTSYGSLRGITLAAPARGSGDRAVPPTIGVAQTPGS
ncbi:hypothetical protein [Nocardia fusca]|uniref:hypothetical protein n=1 Tax=Nocardia fusca TaxID=941183 RepID=UPI000B32DF13|nr:hypothetical protein [Nocardia fusca]